MSEGLAAELDADAGQSVILRVENSSAIPTESLHGRKEDVGRSVRLTVRQVLAREDLGEFSLSPRQGSVRAIFVPLGRMQTLLEQRDRANAILIAALDTAAVERRLRQSAARRRFRPARARAGCARRDRGRKPQHHSERRVRRCSDTGRGALWSARDPHADVSREFHSCRRSRHSVLDDHRDRSRCARVGRGRSPEPEAWSHRAQRLGREGSPGGRRRSRFRSTTTCGKPKDGCARRRRSSGVARIVPMMGPAADRDLVPEYPGITDSDRVADWDPPFPIDLKRVRPIDEEYWNRYRATPKAFIPIERGQQLWSSRHGGLTALRLVPPEGTPLGDAPREQYENALRGELDPLAMGFSVYDVRAQGLAASSGATDFGEYFTYFSTFLVVSALLLAGLFFKLGVEQRLQEVGLLQALGLDPAAIRRLVRGRGARSRRHRRRSWHRRRDCVQRAHHARPAHVVGRCRRDDGADAARRSDLARRRRARSCGDCGRLDLVVAARARDRLDALAAGAEGVGRRFSADAGENASRPLVRGHRRRRARHRAARRHCARSRAARRRLLWRRRTFARRDAVSRVGLAAPRPLGRASWPWTVGRVAPGMAQHGVPAGAKRPVHRPHRLRDVRHRRGRSVQARRTGGARRSPFGRWRISAAGRDAAADRARPQRRGGARCDEPAGRRRAATRSLRSFSCAPRRRHELPESVSAEEPAHHRGDAGLHQQRAICVPQLAGRVARRTRESLAAAQSRVRGRMSFRSSPTPTR